MLSQSVSGGHAQKSSGVEIGLGVRYWREGAASRGKKGCSRKWAVFEFFMVVKPDNKTEYLCFTQFPTNAATSLFLKSKFNSFAQ